MTALTSPPAPAGHLAGHPVGTARTGALVAYLGPSLPRAGAEAVAPGVRFLPPIRQGDLSTLIEFERPAAVLIIDGEFGQNLSVWHKEILQAIGEGVRVIGCSSMGALRAAELDRYGMEGVGAIYEYYRDNFLTADEDVALIHTDGDTGWRPLSWPLVNIRATVAALRADGSLDALDADTVLRAAEALRFRERVAPALAERLEDMGLEEGRALELTALVSARYVDQKQIDARAGLAHLTNLGATAPPAFEPTDHLDGRNVGLRFSDVIVTRQSGSLRRYQLVNDAALHLADFTEIADRAADRYAAIELAARFGMTATAEQVQTERARFLRRRNLTEDSLEGWLLANDLDDRSFAELIEQAATLRQVRLAMVDLRFFERNRRMIIEQLQLEGRYPALADAAARRRSLTEQSGGAPHPRTEEDVIHLISHLTLAHGWKPDVDLVTLADEQGFDGPPGLLAAVTDAAAAVVESQRRRKRVADALGLSALGAGGPGAAASPDGRRVHGMLESHQITQVLLTAVELDVVPVLSGGPLGLAELAAATRTRPDRLERLLAALASLGLLAERDGAWELTTEGRWLDPAGPGDLSAYARDLRARSLPAWAGLADVIRGGEPPSYPNSEGGDRAIHEVARAVGLAEQFCDVLDVPPGGRVIDLGGGLGLLAETLARRRPDVHVALVELPATAARAAARLAGTEVEVSAGGPEGADIVVLQRVVLNLADEPAVELLRTAASQLRPGGRIEVFDHRGDATLPARLADLFNLARSGGHVRNEAEWAELAAAADLRVEPGRSLPAPFLHLILRPRVEATP